MSRSAALAFPVLLAACAAELPVEPETSARRRPDEHEPLAVGDELSCAVIASGQVRCWGENAWGQLGDGTTVTRTTPVAPRVAVFAGMTVALGGVTDVVAGDAHACALHADGGVSCWGLNVSGQLGYPAELLSSRPRRVPGLAGVTRLTAGHNFTCAATTRGEAWCWGEGLDGEIGDGALVDRPAPTRVFGLDDVVDVTAGDYHACARLADGGVACWGEGDYGQLGTGSLDDAPRPVHLALDGVVDLDAGEYHTCAARREAPYLVCWGDNLHGQLGRPAGDPALLPVTVDAGGAVSGLSVGGAQTCYRRAGRFHCRGGNRFGELGNGTSTSSHLAIEVLGSAELSHLATGPWRTCARDAAGQVACAGYNRGGRLGDGSTVHQSMLRRVLGLEAARFLDLSIGDGHACVLDATGRVRCAGSNSHGELGDGTTASRSVARPVALLEGALAVSAGFRHTCALRRDGRVLCWGLNANGALGRPVSLTPVTSPVEVPGLHDVVALDGGLLHVCALRASGEVWCWGQNDEGATGTAPDPGGRPTLPTRVAGLAEATSVCTGLRHSCASLADGTVRCWGDTGTREDHTPAAVADVRDAVDLTCGMYHTCAQLADGSARCWGDNSSGQLGQGHTLPVSGPVSVGVTGRRVRQLAAGGHTTCALLDNGRVKCWGRNAEGQVGDGTTATRTSPVDTLLPARPFTLVRVAGTACAVDALGALHCWGHNATGLMGTGTTAASVPTPVPAFTAP